LTDADCPAVRVNSSNIKRFDGRVGEIAKSRGRRQDTNPDTAGYLNILK
jgi:hypothetical protein